MAATTGPLSTCSSPVLFLIAGEWQCNKHLRRNLFAESLFPDKERSENADLQVNR